MSRESCIKVLQDAFERDMACVGITLTHEALEAVIKYLKDVPSADVPHWIPCSEGLPEEDGEYLVTDVSGGAATVTETYFITDCDGEGHWGALDVIAWMPLPEPYKAKSEEV